MIIKNINIIDFDSLKTLIAFQNCKGIAVDYILINEEIEKDVLSSDAWAVAIYLLKANGKVIKYKTKKHSK